MSAITMSAARDSFAATLSAVEAAVRFHFRKRLRPDEFEEAMAEAMAAAWSSWHGLVGRGKDPVEVGVHGIASNAIRHVRNGRRIGNRSSGRGGMDVYHSKAQARCGYKLVSLDGEDVADDEGTSREVWRDWLAEDCRVTPADEACFRVDFEGWLAGLTDRKRRIVELLAEGHDGAAVARLIGVTPGRVCQVRAELEVHWSAFQQGPAGMGRIDPVRDAV